LLLSDKTLIILGYYQTNLLIKRHQEISIVTEIAIIARACNLRFAVARARQGCQPIQGLCQIERVWTEAELRLSHVDDTDYWTATMQLKGIESAIVSFGCTDGSRFV
jgi:hypothetical protein